METNKKTQAAKTAVTPATPAPETAATPAATTETPATPTAPAAEPEKPKVYESEELTKIRASIEAKFGEMVAATAIADKLKINMEIHDLTVAETAEIARLKQVENDAKLEALKNERIGLLTDVVNKAFAARDAANNGSLSDEQKNAANLEAKTAFDIVANELTARYSSSKPASSSNGTAASTGDRKAIVEQYLQMVAQGKSETDARKALNEKFARSTVWHAINDYKKANATPTAPAAAK